MLVTMIISKSSSWHTNCSMVYDKRFIEYSQHGTIDWTHGCQTPSPVSKVEVESKEELFFKYFEPDSPYERVPFVDKVCSPNSFKSNFLSTIRNFFSIFHLNICAPRLSYLVRCLFIS